MASGFNLRKYHRIKMEVPIRVDVSTPGAESAAEGISINLSQGGIAFEYPQGLVEGDTLVLSLALPDGGERIELSAVVVHCLWPEEGRRMHEIRARFTNSQLEFKRLIRAYIERKAPETVSSTRVAEIISDRRLDERLATEIPVHYQLLQGLDEIAVREDKTQIALETLNQSKYFKNTVLALSDNLSTSGIRIRGEEIFREGVLLALTFQLPGMSIDIRAIGRVAWAKEETQACWAGIQFLTFDKDDAIRMERHLFDQKRKEGS